MLMTISGRIASINEGKYTTDGNPVIDFQLAVDRGNVKKRQSLLTGKEYDVDFYKVSLFGQTAVSFAQYAQVGRSVDVSGRFLQYESLKNQTIQIATDNPLYGYFKQLVGVVPQDQLNYDTAGNLYIKGNAVVNRVNITGLECRWKDKNPNAQAFGGVTAPVNGVFGTQPQAPANGGFSGGFAPSAPATGGFGVQPQAPAQSGFGVQPQATANTSFGVQPQATGVFGVQPQAQGFGVQSQATGFGVQAQPQMPVPQNAGFGGAVAGFGAQPQAPVQPNTLAGFSGQENPQGSAGLPGFGGASTQPQGFTQNVGGFVPPVADGGSAQGFTAPTNDGTVANNAVVNNTNGGNVETNIPTPENTANADSNSTEKKEGETVNQGF